MLGDAENGVKLNGPKLMEWNTGPIPRNTPVMIIYLAGDRVFCEVTTNTSGLEVIAWCKINE